MMSRDAKQKKGSTSSAGEIPSRLKISSEMFMNILQSSQHLFLIQISGLWALVGGAENLFDDLIKVERGLILMQKHRSFTL